MERTYSQIDMDERRKIARWRTAGVNVDVIAEKLGRHRSTIFRELRRNTFTDAQMPELNGYYCVTANDMARERRAKLRKLARFSHLRQSIIERIMHGWSPQQIAGRLQLEQHPVCVSHETIYKFAYSPGRPCDQALAAPAGAPRPAPSEACQTALWPSLQPGSQYPATSWLSLRRPSNPASGLWGFGSDIPRNHSGMAYELSIPERESSIPNHESLSPVAIFMCSVESMCTPCLSVSRFISTMRRYDTCLALPEFLS
jgi:hypothetical protein